MDRIAVLHAFPLTRPEAAQTMKDITLFVLLGLGAGAVIAGHRHGVVVTYIGSGIINLATGAVAMVAAYAFWALKSDYFGFTLATTPAIIVTIVVSVAGGGALRARSSSAHCERRRRWPSSSPRSASC